MDAVHGLKLEIRNSEEMKQLSEPDVYKPTEMLYCVWLELGLALFF